MKKLLVLLVVFLSACGAITYEETVSQTPQPCSTWTEIEGQCQIKFRKFDLYPQGEYESSRQKIVEFGEYSAVRMSFIDGEILIDNPQNILLKNENSETIELNSRLAAGTYYILKQNHNFPASFTAFGHGQSNMVVQMEFAGPPAPSGKE